MSVRIWPQDYERKKHLAKEEKYLLKNASRNFKSGHFVVSIDPLGLSNENVKMGMYISPNQGVITYSLYKGKIDSANIQMYINYVNFVERKIYERLLDSKLLIIRNGDYKILKFPYKHIIMFPEEKIGELKLTAEQKQQLIPYATYKFFIPLTSNGAEKRLSDLRIFSNVRQNYNKEFKEITELEMRAVFERLAPEYTVVMNETEDVQVLEHKTALSDKDFKITGKELEYKTFFLDEYQVAIVNDMGRGHRVLLANPGAGKSVLLLSKAYKYASLYKQSNVLLTCYNYNLADAYNFKRDCANFGENNNLYIMTFHKLVKKIYEECLHMHCESNIATDEEVRKCVEFIKQGKISLRFKAIFIDEVQIFEPLYLELCYLLLEEDEDRVFLMAGDLNQAVRTLSKKGDVPWKKMESVQLDFTGRVRYIERNYRNSKEIGEYLARMLELMNNRFSMLGLINSMEYEYNTFKITEKPSVALKVETGIDRQHTIKRVVASIKEIVAKYKIPYSDIAVLFPYKKHTIIKYYFMQWIQDELDLLGIPFSSITASDEKPFERKNYSKTTGVVLSTIDSSLGLDFKAVIIAGLYPYGYVYGENGKLKEIKSWNAIKNMTEKEQETVQKQMRAVYTACSRSRDILYVLSDIKPNTPMEEIIKKRGV